VIEPGRDERLAIRTWLPYVARIAALHYKRDRTAGKPIGEALDFDVAGPDVIARLEARDQIRVATARLNRRERAIFAGVANGDHLAEVAEALRIPVGTVSNTLRNARIALKKRRARER
jgi:DNA-directed RNA polymerase specialized sigma24 family protein